MLLIGLMLASTAPLDEPAPAPMMCRVAANKIAARLLLGRGILERQDARGVPPEQKARRDAFAKALDEGEAKVLKIDKNYPDLKPGAADITAFDAMGMKQQEALLSACAGAG